MYQGVGRLSLNPFANVSLDAKIDAWFESRCVLPKPRNDVFLRRLKSLQRLGLFLKNRLCTCLRYSSIILTRLDFYGNIHQLLNKLRFHMNFKGQKHYPRATPMLPPRYRHGACMRNVALPHRETPLKAQDHSKTMLGAGS